MSIFLTKLPGRTLGFSIAGGRGSTPAYEDVDEVLYIVVFAHDNYYNFGTFVQLNKATNTAFPNLWHST